MNLQCMSDSSWVKDNDACARNPKDCPDGLTFSIWEKNTFDPIDLAYHGNKAFKKKYLVSSGCEYNAETGYAYPGFSIYREVNT